MLAFKRLHHRREAGLVSWANFSFLAVHLRRPSGDFAGRFQRHGRPMLNAVGRRLIALNSLRDF